MTIQLRPMRAEDVEKCGTICYEAFKGISATHNFPKDFPTPEAAIDFTAAFLHSPHVFNVVAENDGVILGSNHLWEHDAIRAVGPITVAANDQSRGVGRMLMQAVLERGKDSAGIRLVQDAFNSKSLSLYTTLGFDIKEPLALVEGSINGEISSGVEVRPLNAEDLSACARLCRNVHGFDRLNELQNVPPFLTSFVAIRDGRLVAYTSSPHMWPLNHAVAETEEDMKDLFSGVGLLSNGQSLSFLLPTRRSNLFRWFLNKGLRVVKPMTLMAMGEYLEPKGSYLPSVGY
jgi:ribosomal protein S18 acetylase RimI-like enzyme